jgi:hypothetical protein
MAAHRSTSIAQLAASRRQRVMSPTGRPEGEFRSAQHEAAPVGPTASANPGSACPIDRPAARCPCNRPIAVRRRKPPADDHRTETVPRRGFARPAR